MDGIKNSIIKKDDIENLSKKRMDICNGCDYKRGNRCGKCGCVLSFKTRSINAKCPVGKW